MTVQLLPNMEAMVSTFLQVQPELVALVAGRTYTAIPGDAVYPLVRVTQFDDVKVTQRPLWVARFSVQVEAFGGSKAQAWQACATAQALLSERFVGQQTGGVICDVGFGSMRDLPDATFSPSKPRFLTTAYVTAHP